MEEGLNSDTSGRSFFRKKKLNLKFLLEFLLEKKMRCVEKIKFIDFDDLAYEKTILRPYKSFELKSSESPQGSSMSPSCHSESLRNKLRAQFPRKKIAKNWRKAGRRGDLDSAIVAFEFTMKKKRTHA